MPLAWESLDKPEKMLVLTDLLLSLREKEQAKESTICLLCPKGFEAEIAALWIELVDTVVPSPHNESLRLEVLERPLITLPKLFTSIDQESMLLSQYFNRALHDSGIDPSLLLPITPSLDALRAFYLVRELSPLESPYVRPASGTPTP